MKHDLASLRNSHNALLLRLTVVAPTRDDNTIPITHLFEDAFDRVEVFRPDGIIHREPFAWVRVTTCADVQHNQFPEPEQGCPSDLTMDSRIVFARVCR